MWLLIALAVDGIDGPLARRYDVTIHAARFDGTLLDLIIDYLTYVFIPAYAIYASGLMWGWQAWAVLIVITCLSALYFSDVQMKTEDKSFIGFPGCWNVVALIWFILEPASSMILAMSVVLAAAMFAPLRFVHPLRTPQWRILTVLMAIVWIVCGVWATTNDFALPGLGQWVFGLASVYFVLAGLVQQVMAGGRTED